MKFLVKSKDSAIFKDGLTYKSGQSAKNKQLREKLLAEQFGFCAYTEEYLHYNTLCDEVEHFDATKKGSDDYFNYYTVSRYANQRKMKIDKKKTFSGAAFFSTLFFQKIGEFKSRIRYLDGFYTEINPDDTEAKHFIDYLGFNDEIIVNKRKNTVRRLKSTLSSFSRDEQIEYFRTDGKDILSFITAIEVEFNITLEEIITS